MQYSANHEIPTPSLSDPATISAHMELMANSIDSLLDTIAPAQIVGVAPSKLLVANASGVLTPQTIGGDATISSAGVLEIGANKIDTPELKDSAVTTAKIGNGAITNPKIVDRAVSLAKTKMKAATFTISSIDNATYGWADYGHNLGHTNYIAIVSVERTVETFELSWKKGEFFNFEGDYDRANILSVHVRNLTGSVQTSVKVSVLLIDLS